jgi:putative DNA primase/helicase
MIAWTDYEAGNHRIECPSCGRGGRDKTAGLTIEPDGNGVVHCFRCSYIESFRPERGSLRRVPTIKPAFKAQHQKHERLNDWGLNLWNSTLDLSGVALQYLKARHCQIPPADTHLRWHPSLKHPSSYVGPALVSLVTHVHTREHLSLHRTWITPTGKADLDTPRLPLANHSLKDGVIRIWPDEYVTRGLGIAEGIETALSLAWAYAPVWATIDAGHMAQFPVLDGIESLVIAQDKDPAGIAAATICATRWANEGRSVLVTDQQQNDLNDVLKEAA